LFLLFDLTYPVSPAYDFWFSCRKMPVMCRHCSKLYSTQRNLNRHLKESHGFESEVIAYDIQAKSFKCLEGCNISFVLQAELVSHLMAKHNVTIEHVECQFASMESK